MCGGVVYTCCPTGFPNSARALNFSNDHVKFLSRADPTYREILALQQRTWKQSIVVDAYINTGSSYILVVR